MAFCSKTDKDKNSAVYNPIAELNDLCQRNRIQKVGDIKWDVESKGGEDKWVGQVEYQVSDRMTLFKHSGNTKSEVKRGLYEDILHSLKEIGYTSEKSFPKGKFVRPHILKRFDDYQMLMKEKEKNVEEGGGGKERGGMERGGEGGDGMQVVACDEQPELDHSQACPAQGRDGPRAGPVAHASLPEKPPKKFTCDPDKFQKIRMKSGKIRHLKTKKCKPKVAGINVNEVQLLSNTLVRVQREEVVADEDGTNPHLWIGPEQYVQGPSPWKNVKKKGSLDIINPQKFFARRIHEPPPPRSMLSCSPPRPTPRPAPSSVGPDVGGGGVGGVDDGDGRPVAALIKSTLHYQRRKKKKEAQ